MFNSINRYLMTGILLASGALWAAEHPEKTNFEEVIVQKKYFQRQLDSIKNINPAVYDDIIEKITQLPQDSQGNIGYAEVKEIITNALSQLNSGMTQQPALGQNRMTMREFATINVASLSRLSRKNPGLYDQVKQAIKATTDAQGKIDAPAAQQILQDALQKLGNVLAQKPIIEEPRIISEPSRSGGSVSTTASVSVIQPPTQSMTHLIPMNQLKALELCPLYPRYEQVTPEIRSAAFDIKYKEPKTWTTKLINGNLLTADYVEKNLPCVKPEGWQKNLIQYPQFENRVLMQLKTINQNETMAGTAYCAGLSLYNCWLMDRFASIGKTVLLSELYDLKKSLDFIEKYGCSRWVETDILNEWVQKIGMNPTHISVIPTVFALDIKWKDTRLITALDKKEQVETLTLRSRIAKGLRQNSFFHTFIVGDYEIAQLTGGRGHYFSFTIIKVGSTVHYIVLDTQVEAYHLYEGSYEYQRLLYLIELLETGMWSNQGREKSVIMDFYKNTPYK